MKQYIVNKTSIVVSVDEEVDMPLSTENIFTCEIRDAILDRLDEVVRDIMGANLAVVVSLSIDQHGPTTVEEQEIATKHIISDPFGGT